MVSNLADDLRSFRFSLEVSNDGVFSRDDAHVLGDLASDVANNGLFLDREGSLDWKLSHCADLVTSLGELGKIINTSAVSVAEVQLEVGSIVHTVLQISTIVLSESDKFSGSVASVSWENRGSLGHNLGNRTAARAVLAVILFNSADNLVNSSNLVVKVVHQVSAVLDIISDQTLLLVA